MELMNANVEFVNCAKLSVVGMHNIGSPTILTILEKFANFVKLKGFNGHLQGSCIVRWNKDVGL
jgi:hypothetical protein